MIIEDQTAIREMIVELLVNDPLFEVVAQTGDGQEACQLCIDTKPDFIILDVMLPGLNGAEILRRFKRQLKNTRVLVFSGHQTASLVKELLQAGAHGFVEKSASLAELKQGIKVVSQGGSYFGPEIALLLREAVVNPKNEDRQGLGILTARERKILQLIAESNSTKEVAKKLSISVKTAENHRTNLMRKLDLHNIASLTRFAIQQGLTDSNVTTQTPV